MTDRYRAPTARLLASRQPQSLLVHLARTIDWSRRMTILPQLGTSTPVLEPLTFHPEDNNVVALQV